MLVQPGLETMTSNSAASTLPTYVTISSQASICLLQKNDLNKTTYLHIEGFVFAVNHGSEARSFQLTIGQKK